MARYVRELEHCQFELKTCTQAGWGPLSAESLHCVILGWQRQMPMELSVKNDPIPLL